MLFLIERVPQSLVVHDFCVRLMQVSCLVPILQSMTDLKEYQIMIIFLFLELDNSALMSLGTVQNSIHDLTYHNPSESVASFHSNHLIPCLPFPSSHDETYLHDASTDFLTA